MKIYLGGPITNTSHKWRNYATEFLGEHYIKTLDPEKFEFGITQQFELVRKDLQMMQQADVILFNVTKISAGTSMEMVYAFNMNKPTYTCYSPKVIVSPWHKYHSGLQSSDLNKLLIKILADVKAQVI